MGIDGKYGQVTVEKIRKNPISDNEPVMLFRAQDKLLSELLDAYRIICERGGSPDEHLEGIDAVRARVVAWQAEHYTQVPGS